MKHIVGIMVGLVTATAAVPAWAINGGADYATSLAYISIGLAFALSLIVTIGTMVMVSALDKRIKGLGEKQAKIEERLSRVEIRDEERRRLDAEGRPH